MRNQLIIYILFIGLISCTASQRGSSGAAATSSKKETTHSTHSHNSPVFIENISIRTDKEQGASKKSVYKAPATANESTVVPAMSVEMLLPLQFRYAILLDMPVEEVAASKMVSYIQSWSGTPYRYGGNDRTGIDCSAFVQSFILSLYGITLPRTSAEQYKRSTRLKRTELREGDLVFFTTLGRRHGISHVGVYLRNNKFVHAATSGGVTISDLDEPYYAQHYSGAGRTEIGSRK